VIRPQACPAGAHVRHIAAVRVVVVVVEPVYWVVKCTSAAAKVGRSGERTQIQLGRSIWPDFWPRRG